MARYIDADALIKKGWRLERHAPSGAVISEMSIADAPTADVAEVDDLSKQIILKKAEVTEYWKNDVKQYRASKGYSDIEHDVVNFLQGYNEAVEDMLAILDGARMDGDADD